MQFNTLTTYFYSSLILRLFIRPLFFNSLSPLYLWLAPRPNDYYIAYSAKNLL